MTKFHFWICIHNRTRFSASIIQNVNAIYIIGFLNAPQNIQLIIIIFIFFDRFYILLDFFCVYHLCSCISQICC